MQLMESSLLAALEKPGWMKRKVKSKRKRVVWEWSLKGSEFVDAKTPL